MAAALVQNETRLWVYYTEACSLSCSPSVLGSCCLLACLGSLSTFQCHWQLSNDEPAHQFSLTLFIVIIILCQEDFTLFLYLELGVLLWCSDPARSANLCMSLPMS